MKSLVGCLLLSVSFVFSPWGFAQDSDQSSSDSGVLVSSPTHTQVSDQDTIGNNESSDPSVASDGVGSSLDRGDTSNSATDEIIAKSTDAVMFQMKANLKLTQDQISAIRPIITDNIVKVRDLQQSLEKGTIDGKTMYNQRNQLTQEEYQALSGILTPDQMKSWINIQDQQ